MSDVRTLQRSFAGGEITPELFGRLDLGKFQTGLADCRNFIVLPHGAVTRRPGTKYVNETKFSAKQSRLIPFSFSDEVTYILEFGDAYIRFHTEASTVVESAVVVTAVSAANPTVLTATAHGYTAGQWVFLDSLNGLDDELNGRFWKVGTVLTADTFELQDLAGNDVDGTLFLLVAPGTAQRVYEIVSPYDADTIDLLDIHYAQSNDTLTLVHPTYEQRELTITSATNWTLSTIDFDPVLAAPTGVSAVDTVHTTGGGADANQGYTVTAATKDGDESFQATADFVANQLGTAGNRNTITWDAVAGADFYNIYKSAGPSASQTNVFGFIGRSNNIFFSDENIAPDYSITPPEAVDSFTGAGNFPAAASYFEQRRVFGGTNDRPQNIWLTRSGSDDNMARSFPSRDDDSIEFRIASRELNAVKHIVTVDDMLLFSGSAVWRVWSKDSDVLTPTTISVRAPITVGANRVQPVLSDSYILFAAARGGHVYEVAFEWEKSGYKADDVSILAPHMFDGRSVVDMTYATAPHKIVWSVRSDGALIGMTYVPQHDVRAWHRHDSEASGEFESCATVAEGNEDATYFIVKRTVDSRTVRYIERLASSMFGDQEDAFYVDCGLTFEADGGLPVDRIVGLNFLEGETVSVLGDGAVMPQQVVTDGEITLPNEVVKAQIGLRLTSQLKTLPTVYEAQDYGQGEEKNVSQVNLRVSNSSGIFAGPSYDDLKEFKQRTTEPYGSPPSLFSGVAEIDIDPDWNTEGQVCVQANDPLPMTILSMSLKVAIGG